MPCDTRLRQGQTITQRKEEVKSTADNLAKLLTSGKVRPVVSKQGGIAFQGWLDADRNGVTDACAYRRIMATGSQTAKLAIMRAEQLAGRSVDKQAVAQGLHSHDGGKSWHHGH
jgi:hypothetical protein